MLNFVDDSPIDNVSIVCKHESNKLNIDELLQDSMILDLEEDLDFCFDNEGDGPELAWKGSSLVKKLRALKKAPDAPKRFKSAYICYVIDKMEESKQSAEPDVKVTELMKRWAAMWKNLFGQERNKYEIIAEADKTRYFQELSAYSGLMQVPNTRKKKNPCAPKRAMSAFLSYSKEMRPRIRAEFSGMKNMDVSVLLAQRWRAAAENEKKPHLDKERQDRQKYYEDLAVWKVSEEERVKDEEVAIDFTNLPSQLHWGAGSGGGNSRAGSVSDGITGGDQSGSECDAISNSGEGSDANDAQKAPKKRKYAQSSSHTHSAAVSSEMGFEEGAAAVFSTGSSSSGSTAGFWSGRSSGRTLRTDCALDSSCSCSSCSSSYSCAGLSDNVHEGLSAYVTFMDEDQRKREQRATRKNSSSKSRGFLFGGLPLPSAHQTARWLPDPLASAQAHAQAQLLAKQQQCLGAGSNSSGADFWDFMMAQPWSVNMRNMGGAAASEAPTLYNQYDSYLHGSQQESSQFGTAQYQQYQQNDDTASLSSLSTPSGTGSFAPRNTVLPPGWS